MIDDTIRIRIHAVLDRMKDAESAGAAMDAIPDDWARFVSGPDLDGFHFSMRPTGCPDTICRTYDRGLGMGRGPTQMEAIQAGVQWVRSRVPAPDDMLLRLKDEAIALTLMVEALNDVHVRLGKDGDEAQAEIVNVHVQRMASKMDSAQYAILAHLGRGDGNGWRDGHPLNEALWSGQATPQQIREYA